MRLRQASASQWGRRALSTFYDSQSGRHVTVPTGAQVHVGLSTVPSDRVSSALNHLLREDRRTPVKGLASVVHPLICDEESIDAAAARGDAGVWVDISDADEGVAAVKAALSKSMPVHALIARDLCADAHDIQLLTANLGDAGAETILLTLDELDEDELRELIDLACEVDLLGVPLRSRLGLALPPGAEALRIASFAHRQCELLHFRACLAGKTGPRPSELLQALGVAKPDANFSKLYLAEFVPEAA